MSITYIKWLELAAALAAIINWKRIRTNVFLKHLAFLIFFIVAAEFTGYFIKFYRKYNTLFYNFIVEPGIFILYAVAFNKGYIGERNKKFAKYGVWVVLLVYSITLFYTDITKMFNVNGYNLGAVFIGALAILKIVEIVSSDDKIDYFKEPSLYLLLAILFYYLITLMHFSIAYYIYLKKLKNDLGEFLNYVNIIFNYSMYICYIITFSLWGRKQLL